MSEEQHVGFPTGPLASCLRRAGGGPVDNPTRYAQPFIVTD